MSDTCVQCRIGRIKRIATPYITKFGMRVLVLPNAPADLCDVCGYMEYDALFLRDFRRLMRQHAAAERGVSKQRPVTYSESWPAAQ